MSSIRSASLGDGGSIASSVHGEARATMDMAIAMHACQMKPLVDALGRDYYVDADAMRAAVKEADSFNAVHFASASKPQPLWNLQTMP